MTLSIIDKLHLVAAPRLCVPEWQAWRTVVTAGEPYLEASAPETKTE